MQREKYLSQTRPDMNYLEWINEKGEAFVPSRGEKNYEDYLASLPADVDLRLLLTEQAAAFREFSIIVEENPGADLREDGYGNLELFFGFVYFLTKRVYPQGIKTDEILATSWQIAYPDDLMLKYFPSSTMLINKADNTPVASGVMASLVAQCAAESVNEMMMADEVDDMQAFSTRIILLNDSNTLMPGSFLHDVTKFFSKYTEIRKPLWRGGMKTAYSVVNPVDEQFYRDLYNEEKEYAGCHTLAEYLPEETIKSLEDYREQYLQYLRSEHNATDEFSLTPLVGLNDEQTQYVFSLLKEAAKQKNQLCAVSNILIALKIRGHLIGKAMDVLKWLRDTTGIDFTDRRHSKQFAEKYNGDNISCRSAKQIDALQLKLKKKGM